MKIEVNEDEFSLILEALSEFEDFCEKRKLKANDLSMKLINIEEDEQD